LGFNETFQTSNTQLENGKSSDKVSPMRQWVGCNMLGLNGSSYDANKGLYQLSILTKYFTVQLPPDHLSSWNNCFTLLYVNKW